VRDRLERGPVPVGAEGVEILLEQLESISHAGRHRLLDSLAVARELLDHYSRDDQLSVTFLDELAQRVYQLLAIAPFG
jgi:hypothetical protein